MTAPDNAPLPAAPATATVLDQRCAWISWLLAALALVGVLKLGLLPALLAGLLVFELVHVLAKPLMRHMHGRLARLLAVALLSTVVVAAFTAALFGLSTLLRLEAGGFPGLLNKLAEILDGYRASVPQWLANLLPANAEAMKDLLVDWLRHHADAVQLVSTEAGRVLVHIIIGLIIGAMVALREALSPGDYRPLARELVARGNGLAESFRRIVFAQVRISALNTTLTAIYLVFILPAAGVNLPVKSTMVAVTFIAGLLPVIGNLISNSVIVVVSMSHSLHVVVASLTFLVVIHKLEYFLNARIIGGQIHARAWELLIAMLAMEAAFGLPGVVAAPIYYAYLKQALKDKGLI